MVHQIFNEPRYATLGLPCAVKTAELEKSLGYVFKDKQHLYQALCHRSIFCQQGVAMSVAVFGNDEDSSIELAESKRLCSNERLEFLGDAVLNMVISQYLYAHHPDLAEGQLSKWRSALVNEASLAQLAKEIDLGRHVFLSNQERNNGGHLKASILADTFEAVLAAVYLEGGLLEVRKIILDLFDSKLSGQQVSDPHHADYKTALQELTQKTHKQAPAYEVMAEAGADHDKQFTMGVYIGGQLLAQGIGSSKKRASQLAAQKAIEVLSSNMEKKPEVKKVELKGLELKRVEVNKISSQKKAPKATATSQDLMAGKKTAQNKLMLNKQAQKEGMS